MKLAENLSPSTKKLDEVKETTQKVGDMLKESNSENNNIQTKIKSLPNSASFSISLRQMLGSLMSSHNSSKIAQD